MKSQRKHGVPIDVCRSCKTAWVDGGKLGMMLEKIGRSRRRRERFFEFPIAQGGRVGGMYFWLYILKSLLDRTD
jgi:Zn-finger nucleic acid-binding protein